MRLSTDPDRDEERSAATIRVALDAGIRVFDTARAYGRDDGELGHNERLLATVLRAHGAPETRIVTKGGMRRPSGGWEPDGRARTVREDCEASLEALGGLPIDLYLLHAPDPRVPWLTSVRALAQLVHAGLVRRVGLSSVNRRRLDEALTVAPIAAVEIALGPFADEALRGGVVARCIERGIEVLAHSPLGGPERAARLARHPELAGPATRLGVSPQRVVLEALCELHPTIVPVVGARRPETVAACVTPGTLDDAERAAIEARYGWRSILRPPEAPVEADGEVVLVMGVQGAGKSTLAARWVERGYVRINRDERGGSMKSLHAALDATLAAGAREVVADNTYTTRAARQGAIAVARRRGARVSGVWLDTSVVEAQRNVILRMLDTHGRLLEPDEMQRARDPSSIGPGALWRLLRAVEPPSADEGFATLETVPFLRENTGVGRAATFVAIDAAKSLARDTGEVVLVFGWRPLATQEDGAELGRRLGVPVMCCAHPAGPPRCWCRPPLPGLLLALAREHGVDIARSVVVGTSEAHARMATALGARYRSAPPSEVSPPG
jgi:aryl-alcohol dehydrogenase-like predicted oxidoreductase/predicted kinase